MEKDSPIPSDDHVACDEFGVPTDPVERKARIERGLRESRANYLRIIRECDEEMKELEKEKGILERLFGYRTSV